MTQFKHKLGSICSLTETTFVIFVKLPELYLKKLVKAGLLYLINYIIVYLCVVSSYKEEPCDEAAH